MIALRVTVPADAEDLAVTALWELETAGVEVQPVPGGTALSLLAFFAFEESEREDLVTRIHAELPAASVTSADVPNVDWVARFRDGFRAFPVGGFRIVPAWEEGTLPDRHTLRIDPGRAFGTGTHESTRLCLLLLERLSAQASLGRVVDVGAGTGILALAALRLGASLAVAADVDPEAMHSCRLHARLNDLSLPLVRADGGRAFAPRRFDVLLANLTAPLLIEKASELCRLPTRFAVLSGILAEEAAAVCEAFASLDPAPHVERMGEWAGLLLARKTP